MGTSYECGKNEHQRHGLAIDLVESNWDSLKILMAQAFLVYFCELNAEGFWRVETNSRYLSVSFNSDDDMVYFKLTEDFHRYCSLWKPLTH